jgi:NitT/TauT family transport system substrate-binding protein
MFDFKCLWHHFRSFKVRVERPYHLLLASVWAAAPLAAGLAVWPGAAMGDVDKLRLGMVPSTYVEAAQRIAKQEGFFEKNGIEAEFVKLKGDILNLRALIGGDVEIGSIGSFALINAIQKGANLRAFISTVPEQPHMLVATTDVKAWQDLPGKSFAISQPGAISQTFPRAIMTMLGVDPDKVDYLAIGGNSARQKAILAGKVDATLLHKERAVMVATQSDKHHIIGGTADYLPGVPLVYHAARKDWLEQNADLVARYTKSLIQAARFMVRNKAIMLKLGEEVIGGDPKIIEAAYEEYRKSGVWAVDGGLNKEGFDFTIKLGVETGELKQPITFAEVVDSRFVESVLKELGRDRK